MKHPRVLVVGIDGATFKIITPLINKGRLPNISKMMDGGVSGILNSTIPPVSPVAWTSFMTGCSPAKHQIFDFEGKVEGAYEFKMNTALSRKSQPFWVNLSEKGKRVFVAGVTMTYPPDRVNGYMISGLGAPTDSNLKACVHPPDFVNELLEKIGNYKTVPDVDMRKLFTSDERKEQFLKKIIEQIDYRLKLFKYMWDKEKFDFSMLFFLDTDGASHYLWKYMDESHKEHKTDNFSDYIFMVYEKVDSAIGELLETVGDNADVVIVSDHGFGPLNRVVFLNNWLESKGYLQFKNNSIFDVISSTIGRKKTRDIDWEKTTAYFAGTVGNIFMNLKGREAKGTVEIHEYTQLCSRLKRDLSNLQDPDTGEKIVEYVFDRETLNTKDIATAPDLVVTFKRGFGVVGEEILLHGLRDTGEIITDSKNWSGTHEPDGVFIAIGNSFKSGCRISDSNIIDVAPTLLYCLGLPVPEEMEGKVLNEAVSEKLLQAFPVSYSKDSMELLSPTEESKVSDEEEVRERLRNLGYID